MCGSGFRRFHSAWSFLLQPDCPLLLFSGNVLTDDLLVAHDEPSLQFLFAEFDLDVGRCLPVFSPINLVHEQLVRTGPVKLDPHVYKIAPLEPAKEFFGVFHVVADLRL